MSELEFDFSKAPSDPVDAVASAYHFEPPAEAIEPGKPFARDTPVEELPAYLQALNKPQREAALTTEGPLIVIAGAGSGKTKMVTSRIAYLIGHLGVPPYQILAVTFTNKAANEMKERVNRALDGGGSIGHPEIGTFHAVCVRILRNEMKRAGFTKPFVIYDDSDQRSLVKTVMKKLNIDTKATNPKMIQAEINRAKCDALGPEDVDRSTTRQIYAQYQKDLAANNAVDFGEILSLTYRVLRDNEDIAKKYQRRFRYIHVDEYQDTNRVQYLLLSQLTAHGKNTNICVVGDEDQSIYKWRGADIRNILDFEKDYPGAEVVKLEQNYRSTKSIITAASHLIGNNSARKPKNLWTENDDGDSVVQIKVPDERTEARIVVSEIKRLSVDDGVSLDEFAIFYRTHAQSRQFEDLLRQERIPYQVVGGLKFYDRKEIKDVLAYLRVLLNPTDSVSLLRIINTPARGIGKTTLNKLTDMLAETSDNYTDFWSLLEWVVAGNSPFSNGPTRKLYQFVEMIRRLQDKRYTSSLSDLYHEVLEATGYVRELRKDQSVESNARIENLEEFDTVIQEFEEETVRRLKPENNEDLYPQLLPLFIETVTLSSETDQDLQASAVRMMTLHASKGLEFPIVFMVGLEEGLFPSTKPWEETAEDEIEEERRLCYVGMTRAEKRLYMTGAEMRRIWGTTHYQEPSRFLTEIPESLIHMRDLTAPKMGRNRPPTSQPSWAEVPQPVGGGPEGRRVIHPEYGRGVVVSSSGSGSGQKVVIEFQGVGPKKFLLKYVASFFE